MPPKLKTSELNNMPLERDDAFEYVKEHADDEDDLKKFEEIEELVRRQERQGNEFLRGLADRAMQSKDPKTALFTAEGKLLIRETRAAIKTAVDDYRRNPPKDAPKKGTPEYEDSFIRNLEDALDNLSLMDTQLDDYVAESTPSKFEAFAWYRKESAGYKTSRATLVKAMESLDKCFGYIESDKDVRFRKLYASASNMLGMMENIERGNLQVPHPDTKTENGRRVHFVNTVGRPHQPLARFPKYENGELTAVQPESYEESDRHYFDRSDEPLFTHDPCPEDLCQGALGNCYMLSMLSSIAAQDPQFIKDAMVDNGKDVTVRFFKGGEPVYVTVDKKVPGIIDGTGEYLPVFSTGPLWVQIMEKAFAASGIMNGSVKAAEKGTYLGDHRDIERHSAMSFVSAFMGDSCSVPDVNQVFRIPTPNNEKGLTWEELHFISGVITAQKSGMILYAGARFDKDKPEIQKERTGKSKEFTGLYSDHAYSLCGIEKDEDTGKFYVKVRNPHGHKGRVYNNGKPEIKDDTNGYNLVDLKMFGHYFDMVQFAHTETSTLDRARRKEVSDMRAMYGEIVNVIESTLRQSDAFYLKFKNSPSFKKMREASLNVKELFESGYPDPNGIKREFSNLFKAAGDYIKYRDGQTRDFSDECTDRAVNRYQMAELITSLETLYNNNPDMKKADLKQLTECFGKLGENPSQAKQAAVQVHQQRMAADAEKQLQLAEAAAKKQQKAPSKVDKTGPTDKSKPAPVKKQSLP